MTLREEALQLHRENQGKMEIKLKIPVNNMKDLSLAYSPGVAEPCLEIQKNSNMAYDYTIKGNLVGVVTDGTAVLGLGDIGPLASMPVMEGKSILLKEFAGVDAFPICLNTKDVEEIVQIVKALSPTFGAINLEDISAPRCFEIESRLRNELDIPVFHDDQHGTAIVVSAGLRNALKLINKNKENVKIVINGAGAAGVSIMKLLVQQGYTEIIMCDSTGIIYKGRQQGMNAIKEEVAAMTNPNDLKGGLVEAMKNADVFVGVSVANLLSKKLIDSMNKQPIIFALANPTPEISYENAMKWGVKIIATGRSDYPNQINNVLAFPGIFRGALDVRAKDITEKMKLAAIEAIAALIPESELSENYIIPKPFDKRVVNAVAQAVRDAAN